VRSHCEGGAALLISLIMLVIVTMLGLSAMSQALLEIKMAAHFQNQAQLEAVAERNLLLAEQSIDSIPLDKENFDFSLPGDGFYDSSALLLGLNNWDVISTNKSLKGTEGRHEYIVEYLGRRVHLGIEEPMYRVSIRSQLLSGAVKRLQTTVSRSGRREAWTDVLEP